jgi:hypothetical protein
MTEEWNPCVDFPHYEVSSLGRVRRSVMVRGKTPGLIQVWIDRRGYPTVKLQRNGMAVKCYVHRLVGKAFYGLTDDAEIDHRFHDPSDNTQIRVVTRAQNVRNARGQRNHSSRFKGVSWNTEKRKWYACIRVKGTTTKYLGRYDSEEEAAKAYDKAALAAWGEFAFLNFMSSDDIPELTT